MKHIEIKNLEFNEKLKCFLHRQKQQGRGEKSLYYFESVLIEFLDFLTKNEGLESTDKITQARIDKYFDYLSTRKNLRKDGGISVSYMMKHREAVLRFMEYLTNTELGKSDFEIRFQKMEMKDKDILSKDEIQALFNACDGTLSGIADKCILSLLYGCGMRKNELYNVEVNDIDLVRGVIRLDNTKTKQERDIVMSPSIQRILEQYLFSARNLLLSHGSNETHLIITERGKRISLGCIPWRLNKMVERAGLNRSVNPHLLRHSIATHMIDDFSLEEIADFLGHKSLDSSAIYVKIKGGMIC